MATLSHLTKLLAQLPNKYKFIIVQNGVMNIYNEQFILRRAVPGLIDGVYNISMVRDPNGVATGYGLSLAKYAFSLFDSGRSMELLTFPNIEVCKPDISKARIVGKLDSNECIELSRMLQKSGPEVRERMRNPDFGICPAGFILEDHLVLNKRMDMSSIEYFSIGSEVEQLFIEMAMYQSVSIIQCPNPFNEYRMMPIMIGTGWENCVIFRVRRDAAFDLNKDLKQIESDEIPF